MQRKHPIVSIVVRTKDRPKLVKRSLGSVAAQKFRNIEVILVNDGGCDLDLDDIRGILGDIPVRYIRLATNIGRGHAGNTGLQHANGHYIGFLDDDDILYPEHIETVLHACEDEGSKIAYSTVQSVYYNSIDSENAQFTKLKNGHLYDFSFNPSRLLFENYIPFNALLFSKDLLVDNPFDETLEANEDWDILIRLSRKYAFTFVHKITAEYSLFPKDEKRHDILQITEERKRIHSHWFKVVFNKHRNLITGKDWEDFYKGYLIPKHESELKFFRDLVVSEQIRLETELNKHIGNAAQKDDQITRMHDELKQINEHLSRIRSEMEAKDQQIAHMNDRLKEQVGQIAHTKSAPGQEDEQTSHMNDELKKMDTHLSQILAEIQQKDAQIAHMDIDLIQKEERINEILNSESWKITYPFRLLGRLFRFFIKTIRYCVRNKPSTVFRRATVEFYHSSLVGYWLRYFPPSLKQRVKSWLLAQDLIVPTLEISNEHPKVSLVIPIYNHAEHLDACIKSSIDQDYKNLEIIIVDDASPDPRVQTLLNKYKNNAQVKLFSNEKNMGISETQNKAIIHSTGEIIAFLDCDDFLSQNAITCALQYWDKSTVYLHTARTNVDKFDMVIQRISFEHLPRTDYFRENLERMYATHFKLIRRDVFAHVGLFDPRFDVAQDYDMLMRIAFHYPSSAFVFAPEFLYYHRIHEKQESAKKLDKQRHNTSIVQNEARLRKKISEGIFDKMVSIIMLSYGKYEQTYEAIKSISETVKIPFELILFDNGSDSETVNFLKTKIVQQFPFVKLVLNETNLGPAEGRNQALKHAKGDYYIIFDNDEVAQPGWIEELLVRGEASPDIGAVVPRVFFPDNKLQFSGGGIKYISEKVIELLRYDMGISRFDPSTAQFRECEWVPIGATLFKVNPSTYLHSGYQNLFEDAGVSFALRKQGYRLVNAPGALVLHNHFMFRDKFSMKKKYLDDRYNPDGMLRSIASFYGENNLIIYDEYSWKENGIGKLSLEELKKKLADVYAELNNAQHVRCSPYFSIDS